MTRLISALLILAREEPDQDDSAQHCQVDEVLKQVIDEHHYLLDHKPVTVSMKIEQPLTISSDGVLLYVVLANLVRNAFSYTHQGNVMVRLQQDAVVIEDTGIGMSENQLRQIFERHYSSNEKEGHGIGLSLVKRICQRYAWTIQVLSRKNQGTSVQLHFKKQ
jgi:signal transduction histidine kinase